MKKSILFLTLLGLITFGGCTKEKVQSVRSSDSALTSTTAQESSSSLTSSSTTTYSTIESSTDSYEILTEPQNSDYTQDQNQTESTATSPEPTQQLNSTIITTVEQAKQRILDTQSLFSSGDLSLMFDKQLGNDFLFSVHSTSISQQGGSGTAGFYRVTQQGDVYDTDSYGNRFN